MDADIALGGVEHASDRLMVQHGIMKGGNREDFANTAAIDEVGLITQDVHVVVQWCAADSLDCDVDIALSGVEHASDHLVVVDDAEKGANRETSPVQLQLTRSGSSHRMWTW